LGIFVGNLNALEWDSNEKFGSNHAVSLLEGQKGQEGLFGVADSKGNDEGGLI
jgi:hypothetical protein